MRGEGGGVAGQVAVVGKGLTFDSGGYNLKAGPGSMARPRLPQPPRRSESCRRRWVAYQPPLPRSTRAAGH